MIVLKFCSLSPLGYVSVVLVVDLLVESVVKLEKTPSNLLHRMTWTEWAGAKGFMNENNVRLCDAGSCFSFQNQNLSTNDKYSIFHKVKISKPTKRNNPNDD